MARGGPRGDGGRQQPQTRFKTVTVGRGKGQSTQKVAINGWSYGETGRGKNSSTGWSKNIGKILKKKKKAKAKSPDQQLADITNKDFANYKKDFLPVEEAVIADIKGDKAERAAAKQARGDALGAFDRQEAAFQRQVRRTGGKLSGKVQGQRTREVGLARGAVEAGAANLARRGQKAQDQAVRTDLIQAGVGLKGQALQGLGQAATLGNQRDAKGDAMQAQQQSSMLGSVASGAMAGASFGVPGAIIGGGIGLLTSLF